MAGDRQELRQMLARRGADSVLVLLADILCEMSDSDTQHPERGAILREASCKLQHAAVDVAYLLNNPNRPEGADHW